MLTGKSFKSITFGDLTLFEFFNYAGEVLGLFGGTAGMKACLGERFSSVWPKTYHDE